PHIATKTVNFADISLSLHDALPICSLRINIACDRNVGVEDALDDVAHRGVETARCIHLQHDHIGPGGFGVVDALLYIAADGRTEDRKSTRLNSSHVKSAYAVFRLKK